jgi:SAM-dependent methyltransferase
MPATPESLNQFVSFAGQLSGDEKGEAQIFLDRFFQAFGYKGAIEAGATYEERVKKGSKKGKTGFADLVWKPHLLVEMKKQGEDLNKHYSQAFEYWLRLVPDRPKYVLLCNFAQFWIFDFDTQLDTPVEKVAIANLPQRSSAFYFMEGTKPVFNNNQVEVTERAARRMGELFAMLEARGIEAAIAQRFILQCVLAMFAEDRNLLPQALFIRCVQECIGGKSSYDVLGGLFEEMNRPGKTPHGIYKDVDYFNGGLFAKVDRIHLELKELEILEVCAREDWSKVRPAIFGNLFEGSIDPAKRHAHGIHFTSESDIMKIVRPTISRYWEEKIEAAKTVKALEQLQLELQSYRVLDPACGSGNFLYIAYQELKRIEQSLLDKLAEKRRSPREQIQMGFVTPNQFYGIDNNPFAVELARVTMMIARKVAIDKLGLFEPALPLDTLDQNIVCKDALFEEWFPADAIIGNPPFLGGKHMRLEIGDEYIDRVFARFPDVKDSVDFCCYWFRLAHNHLGETGRAGLVGTNSISQGNGRRATLSYIASNNGYIHEAISTQPWSGEAKVHVSIVNWAKHEPTEYFLDNVSVDSINTSLTSKIDVSGANRLKANLNQCFQGIIAVGKGFIVTEEQVNEWIVKDPKNKDVLKLFSMGANLTKNPHGKPERWIIDFANMPIEDACNYILPMRHIRTYVKPIREKNREPILREKWWRYKRTNESMRIELAKISHYFAVPSVSKWAIFIPAPVDWLPGNKTIVVSSEDYYILGVLLSSVHRSWMHAQKSTLKADIAYTHRNCFETFPFPQPPTEKQVEQIRAKAIELHEYRSDIMEKKQWGITKLYNAFFDEPASQLYKLHKELDKLVMQAYGFQPDDDILEKLLELNQQLAAKEANGEQVIGARSPYA